MAGAASFFGAENALDAGSNFVTMRADNFQEAKAAWGKLNDSEKALFKEGFVQTLTNRLREKGDRQDVVNSIFLKSPAARERIRLALGDEGAKQLEAHLRFENIFALTKNIQGNSATSRRMFQVGIAGGKFRLTGGAWADYEWWQSGGSESVGRGGSNLWSAAGSAQGRSEHRARGRAPSRQ